jgi:hypothetical protein
MLPSSADLDLADYKIGSFGSDLDHLRMALKACSNVITPEEYLRQHAAGIEPEESEYDRDELARIIVFATDVLNDLAGIREDAEAIQAEAFALSRGTFGQQQDPEGWQRYKARIREWHEAAIDRSDGERKD